MANFNQSSSIEKGTDAWNIAQGYTTLKILKPLVEIDKLVSIALYGVENIEDSMRLPQEMKTLSRIEAIHRIVNKLREIIENSNFVMNVDNNQLDELEDRVYKIEKVIDGISSIKIDQRTGEQVTVINNEHFNLCLNELRLIKKEINKPLNEKSLIFPSSEEIDLDKLQQQLIDGG